MYTSISILPKSRYLFEQFISSITLLWNLKIPYLPPLVSIIIPYLRFWLIHQTSGKFFVSTVKSMPNTKDCLKVLTSGDTHWPVSDQPFISTSSLWFTLKNANIYLTKNWIYPPDIWTLRQALVCTICSKYAGRTILFICLHFSKVQEGAVYTVIWFVKNVQKISFCPEREWS
jgi:hypothetical protein